MGRLGRSLWSVVYLCGLQYAAICYCVYSDACSKRNNRSPDYPFTNIASQRAKLNAAEHRKGTASGEIVILILPFPAQGLLYTLSRNERHRVCETEQDEQGAN